MSILSQFLARACPPCCLLAGWQSQVVRNLRPVTDNALLGVEFDRRVIEGYATLSARVLQVEIWLRN